MRAMGLALLITLVAFAGCLGGGDDDDSTPTNTATGSATPTGTGTSSPTETGTGTSDPEPEENTPPTASLSASIQQGEVPVNVTFTLDGADADGDALNWTFDADGDGIFEAEGDGTELPATYNHSYASNGTYNATLTVSDGVNSTLQTVTIDAMAAAGGAEGSVVLEGSVATPDPFAAAGIGCVLDAGRRDAGGPSGVTGQDHAIESAWYGYDFSFDVDTVMAEFWDDSPAILGSGTEGQVPSGATYVVVCVTDPSAAEVSYALTLAP